MSCDVTAATIVSQDTLSSPYALHYGFRETVHQDELTGCVIKYK